MTVKLGSDGQGNWTTGTVLSHTDLNETIGATGLIVSASAVDTTEYTSTSATFEGVKSWTFTPPNVNTVIIGIKVEGDFKASAGGSLQARTSLAIPYKSDDGVLKTNSILSAKLTETGTTYRAGVMYVGGSYSYYAAPDNNGFGFLGGQATYVISLSILEVSGGHTSYVDNLKVTIYHMQYGYTDTSSSLIA